LSGGKRKKGKKPEHKPDYAPARVATLSREKKYKKIRDPLPEREKRGWSRGRKN